MMSKHTEDNVQANSSVHWNVKEVNACSHSQRRSTNPFEVSLDVTHDRPRLE